MNKLINQLLIFTILILIGCIEPCKDVVCGPGTCDEGICICPDGYIGDSCEILENNKYFGAYIITEDDCGAFPIGSSRFILNTKIDGGPNEIVINVFLGSSELGSISGTLQNGKMEIDGFLTGVAISINGAFIDENNFTGVYDYTGSSMACSFTMIK